MKSCVVVSMVLAVILIIFSHSVIFHIPAIEVMAIDMSDPAAAMVLTAIPPPTVTSAETEVFAAIPPPTEATIQVPLSTETLTPIPPTTETLTPIPPKTETTAAPTATIKATIAASPPAGIPAVNPVDAARSTELPVATPEFQAAKNVPILMYHTSSEANPGDLTELYVKPSEFEKQIRYLIDNGYTFCTFDDWDKLGYIEKPVMITFDDGYRENCTEIFPLLKQYNAKITIFLTIASVQEDGLSEAMVKEMSYSSLVKFESHTVTHCSLPAISGNAAALEKELSQSKDAIKALTGKEVIALSYPNGEFNETVIEWSKKYYRFGVLKNLDMHNTSYDNYHVHRIRISRSTSLNGFMGLIEN